MYKIVEAFSGIGSQIQAIKNIGMEHEIVATVEWDINAICAYDIIHNDNFDTNGYDHMSKIDLVDKLTKLPLSSNGKNLMTKASLNQMSEEALKRILLSIERNKNLVSISEVKGIDLPSGIDIFTYSFPCQDLSICGFWHGNISGIDRCAMNRSGLLWEVERILIEMNEKNISLPRILVMENVSNILSDTHKKNFNEWKQYLESMGYYNHVYKLCAYDFGMPQTRERVFMISIQSDENQKLILKEYFEKFDLSMSNPFKENIRKYDLDFFLRTDYSVEKYRKEADESQPNKTPSRMKIYENSRIISDGMETKVETVNTITTKQDRFPNSGLIEYTLNGENKAPYRNLTGRECMMLMGFNENQFDKLVENNFKVNSSKYMFTNSKYIKMAGNSIVVQVLENIFKQIMQLDKLLENDESIKKAV